MRTLSLYATSLHYNRSNRIVQYFWAKFSIIRQRLSTAESVNVKMDKLRYSG